jgi:hypothetical protein
MNWGWEQGLCFSPMPRTRDPVCSGLTLWPVTPFPMYTHLCAFIFPLISFWGVAAGCICHRVWLAALDACQALSIDCLSYGRHYHCYWGQHPCEHSCLFVFPPSLVGAELGCECVAWPQFSAGIFASASVQELV